MVGDDGCSDSGNDSLVDKYNVGFHLPQYVLPAFLVHVLVYELLRFSQDRVGRDWTIGVEQFTTDFIPPELLPDCNTHGVFLALPVWISSKSGLDVGGAAHLDLHPLLPSNQDRIDLYSDAVEVCVSEVTQLSFEDLRDRGFDPVVKGKLSRKLETARRRKVHVLERIDCICLGNIHLPKVGDLQEITKKALALVVVGNWFPFTVL